MKINLSNVASEPVKLPKGFKASFRTVARYGIRRISFPRAVLSQPADEASFPIICLCDVLSTTISCGMPSPSNVCLSCCRTDLVESQLPFSQMGMPGGRWPLELDSESSGPGAKIPNFTPSSH